jgi:hypothetical protein
MKTSCLLLLAVCLLIAPEVQAQQVLRPGKQDLRRLFCLLPQTTICLLPRRDRQWSHLLDKGSV